MTYQSIHAQVAPTAGHPAPALLDRARGYWHQADTEAILQTLSTKSRW